MPDPKQEPILEKSVLMKKNKAVLVELLIDAVTDRQVTKEKIHDQEEQIVELQAKVEKLESNIDQLLSDQPDKSASDDKPLPSETSVSSVVNIVNDAQADQQLVRAEVLFRENRLDQAREVVANVHLYFDGTRKKLAINQGVKEITLPQYNGRVTYHPGKGKKTVVTYHFPSDLMGLLAKDPE